MTVYTVGSVDYDIREQRPQAVFSTAEAAMAYANEQAYSTDALEWTERRSSLGDGWDGRSPRGHGSTDPPEEWTVDVFVVDDPGD
jgi:hypothetical protein